MVTWNYLLPDGLWKSTLYFHKRYFNVQRNPNQEDSGYRTIRMQ